MLWRRVRIGVAVVLLFVAAVLGGLWIRSYSWVTNWEGAWDEVREFQFMSTPGSLNLYVHPHQGTYRDKRPGFDEYHRSEARFLVGARTPGRNLWPPSTLRFSTGSVPLPGLFVMFPYWFAVLACIALAAALGLRRPKQYSLRTFFAAVTILALLLGTLLVVSRLPSPREPPSRPLEEMEWWNRTPTAGISNGVLGENGSGHIAVS